VKPQRIRGELPGDFSNGRGLSLLPWSEVVRHLEEWDYRGQSHGLAELALREEILEHLEGFGCDSDWLENLLGSVSRNELAADSSPPPPDRAHPLWDTELDG
jgi:hypothetical protein